MNDLFWPIFLALLSGVFTGVAVGYCLGVADRNVKPQEPEWTSDTVDGAIEWAMAALDARKEKL